MIDVRDQVLEHSFDQVFKVNESLIKNQTFKLIESEIYENILNFVRKVLVEAVSNVISIAFNHLINHRLEEN